MNSCSRLIIITFLLVGVTIRVSSFSPSSILSITGSKRNQNTRNTIINNMIFGKKSQNNTTNPNNSNAAPTFNGKLIKAKTGEKVSVVASREKVPITYSCRKGDCGTCEIMMNGLIVKACQAKIPSGKCDLRTF